MEKRITIRRKQRKQFKDNNLITKGNKVITTISMDKNLYFELKQAVIKRKWDLGKIAKRLTISSAVEMAVRKMINSNYDFLAEQYKQKQLELISLETAMKRESIKNSMVVFKDD